MRGAVLRIGLDRRLAPVIGGLLVIPSLLLLLGDYSWESWITDGLVLVFGASGLAFVLAGFGGRKPDWIDPDEGNV